MPQTIEFVKTTPITNIVVDLEKILSDICNVTGLTLNNENFPALTITGSPSGSLIDAATLGGKLPSYYDITLRSISDLRDVDTTNISDGYILTWNEDELKWKAVELVTRLNDILDIQITDPSDNDILIYDYNTESWINSTLSAAGISTVDHLHDNRYLKLTGGTITGNLTVNESLKVNNISALSGHLTIGNNLTVNGGLSVSGSSTINNSLIVRNNLTVNGGLSVSGSSIINNSLTVSNNLVTNGNITTAGNLKITGSTKVGGSFYSGTTSPSNTTRLNYDGYFYATRVYNAVYNDLAECFNSNGLVYNEIVNRIVEIGLDKKLKLAKEESKGVIGVVSNSYGFLLNGSEEEIRNGSKIPIALAGTLFVDSEDQVSNKNINRFVCAGINGKARVIPEGEAYKYEGSIVGKIIDVDKIKNQYKIIISLR